VQQAHKAVQAESGMGLATSGAVASQRPCVTICGLCSSPTRAAQCGHLNAAASGSPGGHSICCDQLCSERRLVKYSRGRPAPLFERIPGRRAEALDALVYATSAREGVAIALDAREQALCLNPVSAPRPNIIRSKWLDGM